MSHPLRIVVTEHEPEHLRKVLSRLGHQVITATTGRQLVESCLATSVDLAIADIRLPDLDGIEAAGEVNRTKAIPFILVSGYHDAETLNRAAASALVMAYFVKPIKETDLEAAIVVGIARFQQHRQEVDVLHRRLEDRKLVERAKGILMRRLRVDEGDAFHRLQRRASNHNHKLAEVAREIIQAEEVFLQMDGHEEPAGKSWRSANLSL